MASHYPAKLLLFGEYTVLNGSQALAVPLNQWGGRWEKLENKTLPIDDSLFAYVDWMKSNEIIDTKVAVKIIDDAKEGWKYVANIPIGFGLGSSGAYVAAIYDRYISEVGDTHLSVHEVLRKMEGFFHGASSGMDPLVAYTDKALYKSEQGELHTINDPGWPIGYNTFLLDTGMARSTGALVQAYRTMMEKDDFKQKIERELIPVVEHAIHFYLSGTADKLEECLSVISEFQRAYFHPFIPITTFQQWDDLSENPGVYIKFCGAGGGGYFLVVTTPLFNSELPKNLIPIHYGIKHPN